MKLLAIETSCDDPRSKTKYRMHILFTTGQEVINLISNKYI